MCKQPQCYQRCYHYHTDLVNIQQRSHSQRIVLHVLQQTLQVPANKSPNDVHNVQQTLQVPANKSPNNVHKVQQTLQVPANKSPNNVHKVQQTLQIPANKSPNNVHKVTIQYEKIRLHAPISWRTASLIRRTESNKKRSNEERKTQMLRRDIQS